MNIEQIKKAKVNDNLMILLVDHHERLNNRECVFKSDTLSSDIIDRFENSLDSTLIVFYKGHHNMEDIVSMYEELEDLSLKIDSLEYLNGIGAGVNLCSCMNSISTKLQDKLTDIITAYGEIVEYENLNELVTALT